MNSDPTDVRALIKSALLKIEETQGRLEALEQAGAQPIAIVGVGCRFPGGVENPDDFWSLLDRGGDGISEVPPDRWDASRLHDPDPDAPGKMCTRSGGFLGWLHDFDASFFGVAAREAASLDPQQRLLLEVAWEALEQGGLAPDRLAGSKTGVYVGLCTNDYAHLLKQHGPEAIDAYLAVGTAHSVAAGRLSYLLGLQGPSLAVDTACSSSLVAVHLACQSLRNGECDVALAGGVNRILSPDFGINFSKARMLAPDGRCKTFDAAADGFVRAEGCGVIVLKRLSDALAAQDPIQAVIRGSALNQDGRTSGLTVPNGPAQQAVIRQALANARVHPGEVQYVEAHGTGTALGDPIEVEALASVYGETRSEPLLVGSVKTNLGHTEAAAGIAGLIKTVLALQHREIPRNLHFKRPNPLIRWEEISVRVPVRSMAWDAGVKGNRRRAGISSFGFSGTNAHLIVEEAPEQDFGESEVKPGPQLLVLSARTENALRELAARYERWLRAHPEAEWAGICYTAATGRAHFAHRLALFAGGPFEAAEKLDAFVTGQTVPGMFSGRSGLDRQVPSGAQANSPEELARRYVEGQKIEWNQVLSSGPIRRPSLPTYPFQRERHWFSTAMKVDAAKPARAALSTPVLDAIVEGNLERLEAELENAEHFSSDEKAALPRILEALVRRHREGASRAGGSLYEVKWRLDNRVELGPSPKELRRRLVPRLSEVVRASKENQQLLTALEARSLSYILRAFATLGAVLTPGFRFSTEALAAQCRVAQRHLRLFARLLEILAEAGILRRQGQEQGSGERAGGGRESSRATKLVRADGLARTLALPPERASSPRPSPPLRRGEGGVGQGWEVALDPSPFARGDGDLENLKDSEIEPELLLLSRCGANLAAVLDGRSDPLSLIFPANDTAAERLYRDSRSLRWVNRLVGEAMQNVVAQIPPGGRLRALEIGGGTGGTTAAVLPFLPADRTEYLFTDVSPLFLARAREKFSAYPFVRCERLDIEEPAAHFEPHSFDLIIASNVLHATRDLRNACAQTRRLLAPGGLLLLVEGTARQRWIDLIFGLTEGWWRFADAELRPDYPLLPAAQWEALLARSGFAETAVLDPVEAGATLLTEQTVIIAQAGKPAPLPGRSWLVAGQDAETGRHLQELLDRAGHHAALARWGNCFEQIDQRTFSLDPCAPRDWVNLIQALSDSGRPLDGVVLLSGDAGFPPEDHALPEACLNVFREVAGLARALTSMFQTPNAGSGDPACRVRTGDVVGRVPSRGRESLNLGKPVQTWLVTRGAVKIDSGSAMNLAGLAQSLVWGFGKAIALECPRLQTRLLDLESSTDPRAAATQICQELLRPDAEEQLVFRNGHQWVPRLVRLEWPKSGNFRFRADATYLISGGFGFVGLRLAAWLVKKGVRHLALVGRSGAASKSAESVLESLRRSGATVRAVKADVSQRAEVEQALGEIAAAMPPLAGIFHAAGINQFQPIEEIDEASARAVIDPKVAGAWCLHEATRGANLDCFVCFSSAASVWGAKDQAHYIAANQFLDALVDFRKGLGLPATGINWGLLAAERDALEGQGFAQADRLSYQEWLGRIGLRGLRPEAGFDLMERVLSSGAAHATIADVEWKPFKALYQLARRRPLLDDIRDQAGVGPPAPAKGKIRMALERAPRPARRDELIRFLQEELSKALGGGALVEADQPFFDVGMDSLMALQFKNSLESSFECALPPTLAFDSPSIGAMADYLSREVLRWDGSALPPVARPQTAARANPNEVSRLSEEETEKAIARELEGLETLLNHSGRRA